MPRQNKILIRQGTTTPSAGDFDVAEPAWDKTAGKLYVKNAAGSMVEIGGGGAGVTDGAKGDITVSGSGATWTLNTISSDVGNIATGSFRLPNGTTGQRPGTANNGMTRYNTTLGCLESYLQGTWQVIANTALDYGLITTGADTTFDYGALV